VHLSKYFFNIAKSPIGDLIVGLAFGKFSSLLPVKKIKETDKAVAFWHPRPFWEYHVLIVPKAPIKSLLDITEDNSSYMFGVYMLLSDVIKELGWENEEYSTLINGGKRQEIGQLHLHLFKGTEI
jgi:histidine triad (HIT) family protein